MTPSTDPTGVAERERLAAKLRAAGCVWAEDEARVLAEAARSPAQLREMVERRCAGEPLERIVGLARFCGLDIRVTEGVFVPRRRTEYLARCTAALASRARRAASASGRPVRVLDLCCGSGAIAAVVSDRAPDVSVCAIDISAQATACARENLRDRDAAVLRGDLFAPLGEEWAHTFDVIVVNAPYVPTSVVETLPAEARLFEPAATYDGGLDGLDIYRRVFEGAGDWLRPHGRLLVETSARQAADAEDLAGAQGYRTEARTSSAWEATIVIATRC